MKRNLFTAAVFAAVFCIAGLAKAQDVFSIELTPPGGYAGSPGAPFQYGLPGTTCTSPYSSSPCWINIGGFYNVGVQVSDLSGADGSGVVEVWTRSCLTCGPYITATCTNPPNKAAPAPRCNFVIAPDYQIMVNMKTWVSGNFQAILYYQPKQK